MPLRRPQPFRIAAGPQCVFPIVYFYANDAALGFVCAGGSCACPSKLTECSGKRVDTSVDSVNCGACGAKCPPGVPCIDGKCGGISVTTGARISDLAAPSAVLVSRTVKELVSGSGLTFEDRGDHVLKGVPGGWQVFAAAD